jgi:uncharacterized membrane protein
MTNRLTTALIASVILNVFLIGGGVGVLITGARIAPPAAVKKPPPNIWIAAGALLPADRLRFRAMLRDHARAVQPELKAVRAARQEAAALIAEPTLDAKAISDALERARAGETAARSEFDQGFIGYLATMPQNERAALADAMVRAAPGNVRAAIKRDDADAARAPPSEPPKN